MLENAEYLKKRADNNRIRLWKSHNITNIEAEDDVLVHIRTEDKEFF